MSKVAQDIVLNRTKFDDRLKDGCSFVALIVVHMDDLLVTRVQCHYVSGEEILEKNIDATGDAYLRGISTEAVDVHSAKNTVVYLIVWKNHS